MVVTQSQLVASAAVDVPLWKYKGGQATRAEAEKLNNDITAAQVTEWAPAGLVADINVVTVQWANDSHK